MPRDVTCKACDAGAKLGHVLPANVWLTGYLLGFFDAVRQSGDMALTLCEGHTLMAGELAKTLSGSGGIRVKRAGLEELEATPARPARRLALVRGGVIDKKEGQE